MRDLGDLIGKDITSNDITRAAELCLAYVNHGENSPQYYQQLRLCLLEYEPSAMIEAIVAVAMAAPSHLEGVERAVESLRFSRDQYEKKYPAKAMLPDRVMTQIEAEAE